MRTTRGRRDGRAAAAWLITLGLLAGCAEPGPTSVVQLVPAQGVLAVSAQQVHWVAPAPTAPVPGDVRGVATTTASVGLDGRPAAPGDLVLLAGPGEVTPDGLVVPDRFSGAASGDRFVSGPSSCPGGLASRWEVVDVADAVAELRLLDVVLLCGS